MELVVISGKGGTGKTTISTALAELSNNVSKVDCDVDAPNLYLFYKGEDIEKKEFIQGKKANIDYEKCIKCGKCQNVCRFNAIDKFEINPFLCEGCGTCTLVCEKDAISLIDEKSADTYITKLNKGIISRGKMEIGSDGSGKLVTHLRRSIKKFVSKDDLTIVDGSPGIGCSVIASITGAGAVLIVTEPTKSGLQDLIRIIHLCNHFGVFIMICINKYDINLEMTSKIENYINDERISLVGKIPYDSKVVEAINKLQPITKYKDSIANQAIIKMWSDIKNNINNNINTNNGIFSL